MTGFEKIFLQLQEPLDSLFCLHELEPLKQLH